MCRDSQLVVKHQRCGLFYRGQWTNENTLRRVHQSRFDSSTPIFQLTSLLDLNLNSHMGAATEIHEPENLPGPYLCSSALFK